MKKLIGLLWMSLLIMSTISCSEDENIGGVNTSTVTFTLDTIDGLQNTSYTTGTVMYKNTTTAVEKSEKVTITSNRFSIELTEGLYTISFEGKGSYTLDGETATATFKATLNSATVTGKSCNLSFSPFVYNEKADFVIEEIFYSGTVYPNTGKAYIGDQYFKITNNSDQMLYADGLTLVETKFNSSTKYDYTPNIQSEAITADAIYTIPGNGTQYPIEPGKSIILSDKAINHKKEAHENSFDLSKSDFEWFDESASQTTTDTDNPAVPNLNKIYASTLSIWIPNKNGNTAFAIVRMGVNKEEFLANYKYNYTYTMTLPNGTNKEMKQSTYKMPNTWVIDAVQLGTPDKWLWNTTDASLDAGHTYCGATYNDKNKYGKSVRRKVLSTTADGRKILQDTNNSTNDFERNTTPSMSGL